MSQSKNTQTTLLVLLVVVLGVAFLFLPLRQWFGDFQLFIKSLGWIGPFVFALVYVVLTLLLIPGSLMTLGAGAIFGLWLGAGVVVTGANLGALCAFLLARTLMREKVAQWAESNPKFSALDRAIGREGFKMVLLSRLSPAFPFTLLNYLLGVTTVRTGAYVLANLLGMLPATFLYVYIGATAGDALNATTGDVGSLKLALRVVGVFATLAVVILVTRIARRAMAEAEQETR